MTTPPVGSSAPANPTTGALLVATAPTPATAATEALLWRPLRGQALAAWALAALAKAPGLERLGHADGGMNAQSARGIHPQPSVRRPFKAAPAAGRPPVAAVVIVARAERAAEAGALLASLPDTPPARAVAAAPDWRASLAAGLAALPETCAWVIVHDAAWPLLTAATLEAGYAALASAGVALAGEPVNDTLKRVVDGRVVETPPRAALRRLTSPLVIRRDLLARALASPGAPDATGLAEIALASGARVAVYMASGPNPVMVSEADWPVIETLLAARGDQGMGG